MNEKKLIVYSKQLKLQARRLLEENGVLETLSKYGEVIITGSYRFDLMYGPDIDLEVIVDDPRKASLDALKDFLTSREFQKYEYGDFKKFPRENRPESFIIVLVQKIDGVKWEIEVWFFKDKDEQKIKFEKKLMNLNREERLKILRLKYQREQRKISKREISSFEIYQAVLDRGVSDLKEID